MIPARIKKSFARGARTYARHAALQKEVSRRLVAEFAQMPEAPCRVLDIGCGTGFTSLDALNRWSAARVCAIDIALPMARETRNAGIRAVAVADAARLPFRDGTFDAAVSSLAFQWAAAEPGFFGATARVLRPGGRLFFATLAEGTLAELREAYAAACMECTGRPANFLPLAAPARLAQLMECEGFRRIRWNSETAVRRYAGVDELFAALKGTGAAAAGRPENAPRRDILAKTRRYYPAAGGGITATWEIAYFEGERA
ncbi:MAG: methyltransferase domain-containing protein [Nitrospinae bacterium]|nr:methyltransferase domain-containing protein [Nitrospinota bacterium]